jgi:5-methylcytosine-specific restriction endonuclease McrA
MTSTGLLAANEPVEWTDHLGQRWRTLKILRRIKYRYPAALALREFVFRRDRWSCLECGCRDPVELVLDHIISRRNGGSHHPANLQSLCNSCNAKKACTTDRRTRRGPSREL